MLEALNTPMFGIVLSVLAFRIGMWVNKKIKHPLANPLLIAMTLIVLLLVLFDIPLDMYEKGSAIITLFLAPVTAVLALTIYRQRALLMSSLLPVLLGTLAGSVASLFSIKWTSGLLGLDRVVLASLMSKSVTTPIAIAITEQFGGIPALTVASTVISGTLGNLLAPLLAKMFFISDPIAHGVGIGSCSHALGTSKALEIGEVEGAMSSIAISLSGIFTVLLAPLFFL
ncbi:MAG TPA: LrgB family protein [Spirochaetales bacterium]|jgi:putative effector of murein hydrolase|nr:LrgB family protein [Spirochaetales bacterium]